jgi:hypothetical protein
MLAFSMMELGVDPYRLYNSLDEQYRPLHQPGADPRPPQFPERVRAFTYAVANYARELNRKDRMEQAAATGAATQGKRLRT